MLKYFKLVIITLLLMLSYQAKADAIIGWGENKNGQIAVKKFDEKIIDFDVAPYSACVVLESGKLYCQGCATPLNDYGQCNTSKVPEGWNLELGGMRTTEKPMLNVATSFGHGCGINKDDEVECWGCGRPRQGFQCQIPEKVKKNKALVSKNPLDSLRTIDVSEVHSCVILKDGSVECWGCEEPENLGQCISKNKINAIGVAVSFRNTCIVNTSGDVQCFGTKENNVHKIPKEAKNIVSIASGFGYAAASDKNGRLFVWGDAAPNICEKKPELCNKVKQVSGADDYLCVRYFNDAVHCEKTKTQVNFKDRRVIKDRKPYAWINDAKVRGISTDFETNMIIVDNGIIDILEKRKVSLPKEVKKMDRFEYIKNRKVMPQSEVMMKNKAKYDFENHMGMKFKSIPKGEFEMGGCGSFIDCMFAENDKDEFVLDSERPHHKVKISKNIQVGIYEVTIGEYKKFLSYINESKIKIKEANNQQVKDHRFGLLYKFGQEIEYAPEYYPVVMVSWDETKMFLDWLNKTKPESDKGIYRLPSESEWEYFARAGTKTMYWNGNDITGKNVANCIGCIDSEEPGPMPVGSFPPNPFGLYDIHGNVDEWVEDCIDVTGYSKATKNGEPYLGGDCKYRGARGGSWEYAVEVVRSAWRDWYEPREKSWEQGFRIVRELK